MERQLLVFVTLAACTYAQRPMYAGTSAKGVPELASRFKDPADDVNVVNRAGTDDVHTASEPIPVDARGDVKLVQRVNTWPKENRPFWVLNAEQIERHRNTRPGVGLNQSRPGVGLNQSTGNGVTANQEQKMAILPEQQRKAVGVDQEEAMSNQQQRRLRPDNVSARTEISSRSGDGYGGGSRALFTPEEVLWDSRGSRLRSRNY